MEYRTKIRMKDFSKWHDLDDNSFRNFLIRSKAGFGGLGSRWHFNIREPIALKDTHILARISRPSNLAISPREALVWERKWREILLCREEHQMRQYCSRHRGKRY